MIIQESGDKLVLRRYAGTHEGKSLDKRIGDLPRETSPNAVPADLIDELTPKELRQLQARLTDIQKEVVHSKVSSLVSAMNDLASALDSGLLDGASVEALHKAASGLSKRSRKAVARSSSGQSPSEPS